MLMSNFPRKLRKVAMLRLRASEVQILHSLHPISEVNQGGFYYEHKQTQFFGFKS